MLPKGTLAMMFVPFISDGDPTQAIHRQGEALYAILYGMRLVFSPTLDCQVIGSNTLEQCVPNDCIE